jgi:hypothetical protein
MGREAAGACRASLARAPDAMALDAAKSPLCAMTAMFFDGCGLQRLITFLCNARAPGNWDPVTSTMLDLLTGRLQFCLTEAGLVPFKGKSSLVYPYHMMSPPQKEFLRESLARRDTYCVCNDAVVFQAATGDAERLGAVEVLQALCSRILASRIHPEHKVRVGVCNIILQRVQSVVPISRNVQQALNAVLFGPGA